MRDPKRIKPVLAEIEKLWNKYPDWRLGQLLCNVGRMNGQYDVFFMEDDTLKEILVRYNNGQDDFG